MTAFNVVKFQIKPGTDGIGALSHIGAEQLMQATGIRMVHVPYRGAPGRGGEGPGSWRS